MEVQEAFTKIQEQSKTLFLQPELVASALTLLNGQNLNYFQAHHQAELFRLRGICFQVRILALCKGRLTIGVRSGQLRLSGRRVGFLHGIMCKMGWK